MVEIRSPGDETMEKLPFYARLGVPEVWVVDRDTRQPELYVLRSGRYERQSPAADGWLHSDATGVELRGRGRESPRHANCGDTKPRGGSCRRFDAY